MLKMGTVKGFKHFATYLRGKEEMVISVVNEPQVSPKLTLVLMYMYIQIIFIKYNVKIAVHPLIY
jgi:hypothetical protein